MEGKSKKVKKSGRTSGLNQNMVIAIIGAVATIAAALIPYLINANKSASPQPTSTPVPEISTATPNVPNVTSLSPTNTFTPEPPTATPTIGFGLYDVYLALDPDGEFKSNTFAPEQLIYAFFKINDPSDLRKVKAIWYAVDVPGLEPNLEIYRTEDTLLKSKGSAIGGGSLWKPGKYKVELYLNGQLSSTQEFEIKQ